MSSIKNTPKVRIVQGFPKYKVSTEGRVWSLVRGEWREMNTEVTDKAVNK